MSTAPTAPPPAAPPGAVPAATPVEVRAPGPPGPPGRSPGRPARRRPSAFDALRWSSPLLVLALWQLASGTGLLPEDVLAPPSRIATAAWDLTREGDLPEAVLVSLRRAAIGLLIGAAAGVLVGLVAGLSRIGEALLDPPMQMIRTIPLFGLVPLFILWFGIGEGPKVGLVALGVAVPLYLNLLGGLRGVDPELLELGRSLRLSRAERLRHVVLPAALPSTLVGLRQSLGIAWLALIVAEQINADAGLGFLINNARDFSQTDVIVVGLIAYAVLGLVTDGAVRLLERRALRWRGEGQAA